MSKDVVIRSYEGDVKITNVPNSISKEKLFITARDILNNCQNGKGFISGQLSNVEYLVNDKITEYELKNEHEGFETKYDAEIDYSDLEEA